MLDENGRNTELESWPRENVAEPDDATLSEATPTASLFQLPTLRLGDPSLGTEPLRDTLRFEFGRTCLPVARVDELTYESVVRLSEQVEAPIRVLRNNQLIAHGEVVIVDEQICIRVTEPFGIDA